MMSDNAAGSPVRAVRQVANGVVVDAVGEINLEASSSFQKTLLEQVDKNPGCLVVNLSGVDYMDSSGVASLVKVMSRCRAVGVSLRLAGLTRRVRSIMEITRLDKIFDIHDTVEAALT